MLRPTAVEVYPQDNYHLRIVFDNGEVKLFDVRPYIQGEWYGQLSDKAYFRAAKPDGYTIDLCPDELYEMSIKVL